MGRRKSETKRKIVNIAIPEDRMQKVEVAKTLYDNSVTQYINHLIEKDLDANYHEYEKIIKLMDAVKNAPVD